MRTPTEIKEYLMLNKHSNIDVDNIIKQALFIEEHYEKEIKENNYGYALSCDFINSPFILEDEDMVETLEKIKEINGLVVYKIIWRN